MTAPRWSVLLLLSAVFGMHGIQCMGADSSMPTPHAADAASSASASPHVAIPAEVAAVTAVLLPAPEGAPSVVGAAVDRAGHRGPAGLMDHLGAVCLAVLAAGLGALVLVLSRVRSVRPGVLRRRVHRWLSSLDPPRAPDIHFLCVLRT